MALWGQVLLLRELLVASFGVELACLFGLALLLTGTAAGSALARRVRWETGRAALLLAALGAALPPLVAFARAQHLLLGGTPGTWLSPGTQLAGATLALLPFGLLGGALFSAAARLHLERGGSPGGAYAWESAGGVAGGLASTALLAAGLPGLTGALGAASVAWAVSAAVAPSALRRAPLAVAALLALGAAPLSPRWDTALSRALYPELAACADTPYGRLRVDREGARLALFLDGALLSESEGTSAEEFVHPSALAVESPRRVLLVGGALEGLAAEVLKHRPERVDLFEVDERAYLTAAPLLPASWREALASPLVHLRFGDPRREIAREGPWDLVLVGMPEPGSGMANRCYTSDFFAQCAGRMAPGAVLALRLRGSESLRTPLWLRRTASLESSLAQSFPHRLVLPGPTYLLLASRSALPDGPDLPVERWNRRGLSARLVSPPYLRYLFERDRIASVARELAATPSLPNTDAHPVAYPFSLGLWASRLWPRFALREPLAPLTRHPLTLPLFVAAAAAAAAALLRRRPVPSALLMACGAGAAGMSLEGALLLAYQVRRGVLYQDLGLLLTGFMVGLAAGAALAARGPVRPASRLALAGLGAAALAAWALWSTGRWPGLAPTLLLMALAGGSTGSLFETAARRRRPGELGALYAADLLGGVAGALLTGLLLLPFAGLPESALAVAVGACALLAVRLEA